MIQDQSEAGLEYQEKNPINPTRQANLLLSIIFSPYSYDFLKEKTMWNVDPDSSSKYYSYYRFISILRYTIKLGKIGEAPKEVKEDNVPANTIFKGVLSGKKKTKYSKKGTSSPVESDGTPEDISSSIFIDCSKKDEKGNLALSAWAGYLSYAISEVKDFLFRLHKNGYWGKVRFIVIAYHPLDPLAEAFCNVAGLPVQRTDVNYSGFTDSALRVNWFKNFKKWLEKYEWTPELEECAFFDGRFYGGSERTDYSIAMERIQKVQNVMDRMRPYIYITNILGKRKANANDSDMVEWKQKGGATTDGNYENEIPMPVYHYRPDKYERDGRIWDGKGLEEDSHLKGMVVNEQPLGFITYSLFDLKILEEARCKLLRLKNKPGMPVPDVNEGIDTDTLKDLVNDYIEDGHAKKDKYHPEKDKRIRGIVDGKYGVDFYHPWLKPINYKIGTFFTYIQLEKEKEKLFEIAKKDPLGPKWWIGPDSFQRNKWAVGVYTTTNQIDDAQMAKMLAKERKDQLSAWEESVYKPQMAECARYEILKEKRDDENSDEYEIWKRKNVEDEDISEDWSAGKDDFYRKGKQEKLSYYTGKKKKLNQELIDRKKEIEKLEDYAALATALKTLSAIQLALGIISMGATSAFASAAFLVIDSMLEIGKMGFELYYRDDYTLGNALQDHMFSFINNLVSGLLLHSTFAKFTESEISQINHLNLKPGETHLSLPSNYFQKQMWDFNVWVDNISNATKGKNLLNWDKYRLAASGAKAVTFGYTVNSLYESAVFITNKHDMSIQDMINFGIIKDK